MPPLLQQGLPIIGIGADGGQRLTQFMVDAGRHLPQRCQLGRLYQLILCRTQLAFGMSALLHLPTQLLIDLTEICGTILHPLLQLGMGAVERIPRLFIIEPLLQTPFVTLPQPQSQKEQRQCQCRNQDKGIDHLLMYAIQWRHQLYLPPCCRHRLGLQ